MFAPFTNDEVESIRSIVLLGQQKDDMLLSNCSKRPILQTRSFIRRFKRDLLDTQVKINEITNSANEQYVAIIAGVRLKRNNNNRMTNATSVTNLASPIFQSVESVPYKFRSKFVKFEPEIEVSTLPPPLPTRSKSVSENLGSLQDNQTRSPAPIPMPTKAPQPKPTVNIVRPQQPIVKTHFQILPPLQAIFPRACKNASELKPGTLATLLSDNGGPAIICRVLGQRVINGTIYLLISFFQSDFAPSYVQPHHLMILPPYPRYNKLVLPNPLTIDALLERIIQTAQVIVIDNIMQPQDSDPVAIQRHRELILRILSCAAHLVFLDFAASYVVSKDKLKTILKAIGLMNPIKYVSNKPIHARCIDLIDQILSCLD